MELSRKFESELYSLNQAVDTFDKALNVSEDNSLDEITKDLIKNDKIQKFEYCAEPACKISKIFLQLKTGEIQISPKQVYKTMFLTKIINENLYQSLFHTIEDRNKLSHIYKEDTYDIVYNQLENHLSSFKQLLEVLKAE